MRFPHDPVPMCPCIFRVYVRAARAYVRVRRLRNASLRHAWSGACNFCSSSDVTASVTLLDILGSFSAITESYHVLYLSTTMRIFHITPVSIDPRSRDNESDAVFRVSPRRRDSEEIAAIGVDEWCFLEKSCSSRCRINVRKRNDNPQRARWIFIVHD